jgi:hypothetical protein
VRLDKQKRRVGKSLRAGHTLQLSPARAVQSMGAAEFFEEGPRPMVADLSISPRQKSTEQPHAQRNEYHQREPKGQIAGLKGRPLPTEPARHAPPWCPRRNQY